jgi:hypothetical protein
MSYHVRGLIIVAVLPLLSACVAQTAAGLVTAPVHVASSGVDAMTTSHSEADEKRDRDLRRREAELNRLERDYNRHSAQCLHGEENACDKARTEYGEIQDLRPTAAAPPR